MARTRFTLTAFALGLFATVSHALPEDRDLPLQVTSDTAEFDELAGIATYQGDVRLSQGSLLIEAQTLTAYLEEGQVVRLTAQGQPAFFEDVPNLTQGMITGTASDIEWTLDTESMLLRGSAVLTQDTNRFAGEQVNYLQKTGVIEAQGGDAGRVEMTLTPKKSDP